jgi:hypothetical protein
MNKLPIHLALHGVLVLTISLLGGLFLYKAILKNKKTADWHLLHAGGSARGILLIALAAIIHMPVLPLWQLSTAAWLTIFFVWTSTIAMVLRAVSGAPGFKWSSSGTNKLIYVLYVSGTIAIFPACLLFTYGLFKALLIV